MTPYIEHFRDHIFLLNRFLLHKRCAHKCFLSIYVIKIIDLSPIFFEQFFNKRIHQKWSLVFLKLKFSMLHWNCLRIEC